MDVVDGCYVDSNFSQLLGTYVYLHNSVRNEDEAQVFVLCLLISTLFFMLYLDEAKIRMLERDKEETYKKNIK